MAVEGMADSCNRGTGTLEVPTRSKAWAEKAAHDATGNTVMPEIIAEEATREHQRHLVCVCSTRVRGEFRRLRGDDDVASPSTPHRPITNHGLGSSAEKPDTENDLAGFENDYD